MEQQKNQQTLKEEKTMDILSQEAMSFIKGGDDDPPPPPPPPPVGNGDDENG